MKDLDFTLDIDPAVTKACESFLAQLRAWMSVDGVVVLLLEQAVSRVVFSWEASGKAGGPEPASGLLGLDATQKENPPMCITLKGSNGVMGAVLIRGAPFGSLGPMDPYPIQKPVAHLAALLENILLQHRLERNAKEGAVLGRISEAVDSRVPVEQVYQLFAKEIIGQIDYHRLSVFLARRNSSVFTYAYRTGPGMRPDELKVSRALSGKGFERVVSECQSAIVGDLLEGAGDDWPEFFGDARFRSALIVPVVHRGDPVGVVSLENRLPKAYGPIDENLLLRAATLLGPIIANPGKDSPLTAGDDDTITFNRLAQILASDRRLDEVFEDFALASENLIDFDRMTLAWLDHSGCDILSLSSCPSASGAYETPEAGFLTNIKTTLKFGQHDIGTLSLWRRRDELFAAEDGLILERLGVQVSAMVQYDRLYRMACGQFCQFSQPEAVQVLSQPKEGVLFDSLRQQFLVDTAHSLLSPLSSIKGYSSTLLQPDASWPPDVRQEFLETIDREADQLNWAINDLLGSMESDSSTVQVDRSVLPVQSIFRLADAELTCERGIATWFQCEPDLPLVLVDQVRLVQVIVYLVNCARRAAASVATLTVQARRKGEHVRIIIGFDHGKTEVDNLIELPLHQTIRDGNVVPAWVHGELMLTICQTLLTAHGVDLYVGTPGTQGDIFWFELPVTHRQLQDAVASP